MHESLLGADYPLFAATEDDVLDALTLIGKNPDIYTLAADRCRAAATSFTLDAAAERLGTYLSQSFPEPSEAVLSVKQRPLRVGVAGHDLKF
ncbi:glycosyltransferase family 1 protein, partial [Micromonospora aurantiaca]|nr:glycosyltransferase family 1 protein [Micromonospora aurantiaca]